MARVPKPLSARKGPAIAVGAVALGVVIALYASGISTFPLVASAIAVWTIVFSRRMGVVLGFTLTLASFAWALFVTAVAAHAFHVPMGVAFSVVVGGGTAWGLAVLTRAPRAVDQTAAPSAPSTGIAGRLAVLVGPVAWVAVILLSHVIRGASTLSWVMCGDAANNMVFARDSLDTSSRPLVDGSNPVPLYHILVDLLSAPGRGGLSASELFLRDVTSASWIWHGLIVLTCLFAGLVVRALSSRATRALRISGTIATACASLFPLGYFVTGYPIEFGFVNSPLTQSLLFGALLSYLYARRAPRFGLVTLGLIATLLLFTWSPLVLVPCALAVAEAWRLRRAMGRASVRDRVLVIGAWVQLVGFGVLLSLPVVLDLHSVFGVGGGAVTFPKWMLPALISLVIAAAWSLPEDRSYLAPGLFALCGSFLVSLLGVLILGGNPFGTWSYYPDKLAWLGEVTLAVVLIGLLPNVGRGRARGAVAIGVALAATLGVVISLGVFNPFRTSVPKTEALDRLPARMLLNGTYGSGGDRLIGLVEQNISGSATILFWGSGEPLEQRANFWVLMLRSQDLPYDASATAIHDLRFRAYFQKAPGAAGLCQVATLTREPVVARTSDPGLKDDVLRTCGSNAAITVVVDH